MKTFSTVDLIKKGWQLFVPNKWLLIFVSLVLLLISQGRSYFVFKFTLMSGLIWLALFLAGAVVQIGYFKIVLNIYDGKPVKFEDVFKHFDVFWKYISLVVIAFILGLLPSIAPITLFYLVIKFNLALSMIAILGLIFGVIYISFMIFIITRLSFASIIVVDKDFGPISAIKESMRITKGYSGKVFWALFVLGLFACLGLIAFGVGILVTAPITCLALVHIYRTLSTPATA